MTASLVGGSFIKGYFDRYSDIEICVFTNGPVPCENSLHFLKNILRFGRNFSGVSVHTNGSSNHNLDIRFVSVEFLAEHIEKFMSFRDITNKNQDFLYNVNCGYVLSDEHGTLSNMKKRLFFSERHRDAIVRRMWVGLETDDLKKSLDRFDDLNIALAVTRIHKVLLCMIYAVNFDFFRGYKCTQKYLESKKGNLKVLTLEAVKLYGGKITDIRQWVINIDIFRKNGPDWVLRIEI